ncbi:MAG: hypothetical protein ACTSSJ_02040 [Candidatus Odinarchaeia archaeon]
MDKSTKTAELLSIIISPTLTAAATSVILSDPTHILLSISLGILFNSLLPTSLLIYESYKGVTSVYVPEKLMRPRYLGFAAFWYSVGFTIFWILGFNGLQALASAYFIVSILCCLTSYKFKISIHSAGVSCPATVLTEAVGIIGCVMYILLLPVTWSRIKLKAHTPLQIVVGVAVGVLAALPSMLFF